MRHEIPQCGTLARHETVTIRYTRVTYCYTKCLDAGYGIGHTDDTGNPPGTIGGNHGCNVSMAR